MRAWMLVASRSTSNTKNCVVARRARDARVAHSPTRRRTMGVDEERITLLWHEPDPGPARASTSRESRWRAVGLTAACALVALVAAVLGSAGARSSGEGFIASLGFGSTERADGEWMSRHEPWRIVSFVSEDYEDIARLWYHRLSKLGYTSHHLVALDDEVFGKLNRSNFRILRAPGITLEKGADLGDFWKFRLRYLVDEINRGQNILMSDLDVIFAHHYEPDVIFNKIGDEDVDIFHSLGAGWPLSAKRRWGFSVCMGFSAFRATKETAQILDTAYKVCTHAKQCDDQVVVNELYMNYLQMTWTSTTDHGERKGISRNRMFPLVVKTFSNLVPRVRMESLESTRKTSNIECLGHVHHMDGGHWAVAPVIEKEGHAKLEMWKEFRDQCFPATVAALGAQWRHR